MSIRITTLSENTANFGFIAEWGLSILVELDNLRVLLDTGLGFSAVYNAQILGLDLYGLDTIVISHGHTDHTGGLKDVLTRIGSVDIIAHPAIWEAKYAIPENGHERYIGIPFNRDQLEGLGARFRLTKEPVWISNRVVTSGEIPLLTGYEKVGRKFHIKENGKLRQDYLPDDLALGVKTDLGLIIILGCAHRGMINTIHHFQEITGEERVYCVVGGTHLIDASRERLEQTVADLRRIGIQRLGVSHCTGFQASAYLAEKIPHIFFPNHAGNQFTLC
jgi:7,8-dihydropterin-6-yl-methyl-4-(beta-D-ribofuranosyl)aminobenzene 5'-phosphate synthase